MGIVVPKYAKLGEFPLASNYLGSYYEPLNPFSAAVPIREQTTLIPSSLSPERDCSPWRVNTSNSSAILHAE